MSITVLEEEMVHFEMLGRGRPVIFLHGWLGSWRYWIPAMMPTSLGFRTYALDFWGFGETAKSWARYSLSEQIRLLDLFFEKMGMMRVALVGHGLGAVAALQYAENHPDLVDRVMAVAYPLGHTAVSDRLRNETPSDLAASILPRSAETEPVLQDSARIDPLAVTTSLGDLPSLKLGDLVRYKATPTLLVSGDLDPLIKSPRPDEDLEMPLAMHIITLDEARHFPMIDQTSKFNRLLSDFLALPSGESPRQLMLKDEWKRRVR